MTPISSNDVDRVVKEIPKRKATPPDSAVVDGAVRGSGNSESSSSAGDPPPSLEFTKESVAQLKAHISENRGEC